MNVAPGQTVQLQWSPDLTSSTWTDLGNPLTSQNGSILATDTPERGQPRFYRVLVVQP